MCRISRDEAVRRIKQLEAGAKDRKEALCYIRAYNAIMSCRTERKTDKERSQGGQESSRDR